MFSGFSYPGRLLTEWTPERTPWSESGGVIDVEDAVGVGRPLRSRKAAEGPEMALGFPGLVLAHEIRNYCTP